MRDTSLTQEKPDNFLDFLIEKQYLTGQHAETIRMLQNSRFFFGVLALREDLISVEQLEEVLRTQATEGYGRKIGEIMLDLEYISQEQVDRILNLQDSSPTHQAELVSDVGLMSDDDLKQALDEYNEQNKTVGLFNIFPGLFLFGYLWKTNL